MKTTVDLPDELVAAAKAYADRKGLTLHSLIERGLRLALGTGRDPQRFRLRDQSVMGRGLQATYRDADWARIRESGYRGRGG